MGFSSQEYWSVLSFSSPGDLPGPEIEPHLLCFLHWQVGSLPLAPLGKWGLEEVLKCHSCLQILASLMPPSKISPDIHLVKLYIFINISAILFPYLNTCERKCKKTQQGVKPGSLWNWTWSMLFYFHSYLQSENWSLTDLMCWEQPLSSHWMTNKLRKHRGNPQEAKVKNNSSYHYFKTSTEMSPATQCVWDRSHSFKPSRLLDKKQKHNQQQELWGRIQNQQLVPCRI